MTTNKMTRHFVTIGGVRQVHYRRAGKGPVVLLLHQSPKSAKELEPLIELLSDRYTLIAPDRPGNGLSDRLGIDGPTMYDYADGLKKFLDAIGLDKVAIYGFHTGACEGAAFVSRYPERVHGAILNGVVSLAPDVRADYLANYLTSFKPQWDGGHMVWAWARFREQSMFFPWHAPSLANRHKAGLPNNEFIHEQVMEFLRSGDEYRNPYGAAFKLDGDKAVASFKVPAIVCASQWDPLVAQLPAIAKTAPSNVTIKNLGVGGVPEVWAWLKEEIGKYAQGEAPPPPRVTPLKGGRTMQDYIDIPGGQLHVRRTAEVSGRPLFVQHDAASDNSVVDKITRQFDGKRTTFALDLPGNGESDNTIGPDGVTVARYAAVVGQAMDSLGIKEADFYGMWGGGLVGLELANQRPAAIKHLAMSNVIYLDEAEREDLLVNYTFPIVLDKYGAHLLKCWHAMRDQGLWWPWYNTTRSGIIREEPYVDPEMIHTRVLAMLKARHMWQQAYESHFRYDTHGALQRVSVPTLLCAPKWDPNYPHTQRAHAAAPKTKWMELPAAPPEWAGAMLPFLNS